MNFPPAKELVGGIIREQSLVFLAGEEGSGKSITAMNLGLCVAAGKDKFLNYPIVAGGKVLYLNNELPFEEFGLRLKRMLSRLTVDEQHNFGKNFLVPESVPPMNEFSQQLNTILEQEKPAMVILDCLYWSHDKKENDSSEMKELMRRLVDIRDTFHVAVVVIHHTKKGVRYETMHVDNMRGSSVFGGATDSVLMFRRSATTESMRLIKPAKLRHGDDDLRTARLLQLDPENLWFMDLGAVDEADHIAKQETTAGQNDGEVDWNVVFAGAKELGRKEIVERMRKFGKLDRTVDRALRRACTDSELVKVKAGVYALPETDSQADESMDDEVDDDSTLPLPEAA
jgi:hypothetical protein